VPLLAEYREAQRDAELARLRRLLALRAMVATGMRQRQIAEDLGITQPAVSQQLQSADTLADVHPESLVAAAGPILTRVAEGKGFTRLAVFGSVARHRARKDSDIDLLVQPPPDTSIGDLLAMRRIFEQILGRPVDLVTYGGLRPGRDDDILRETVLL
jgi:predicted nucleotidyltransferase